MLQEALLSGDEAGSEAAGVTCWWCFSSAAVARLGTRQHRWRSAGGLSCGGGCPDRFDPASQRERFTPALVQQLEEAFRLSPADGRFVDFAVFSGTQVLTYGARVLGCTPADEGPLDAPLQLRYQLLPVGRSEWRIADISYPSEPGFSLSRFPAELLRSPG